jgi:hypothetical protein
MKSIMLSASLFTFLVGCTAPGTHGSETLGESAAAISGGTVYNLKLPLLTNSCVNVASNSSSNGAKVDEWQCNGTTAQNWVASDLGNGYFNLTHQGTNQCLNLNTANLTKVQQYDCQWAATSPEYQWQFQSSNGYYQIVSKYNGQCLDVTGASTANGTQVQTYPCNGTGAQTFNPVPVTGGTGGGGYTKSFSTWYCGNACGTDDTGSCGTTYCGTQVAPTVMVAALSQIRMNGSSGVYNGGGLCGKQIEVVAVATGASVVVPVEDACEACNADDHVDLSLAVWQALGVDPCAGTFQQQWRFVN